MTHPCAEHEALLQISQERVKRLEEALRAVIDGYAECVDALSDHGRLSADVADDIARLVVARLALRPEGT